MALRTIRSGASAIPEADVLQFITDLLAKSGVFDNTGTQFQVTGSGTGLSVNVAAGRAYLLASGGNGYPVINDASVSVSINSNASGNPRITSIVLYADLSASPNADASNVAKIIAVDGTPAPSPSAPSASTIQTAVGSSNPYIVLDNVTVNSGASVINTSNCLDVRPQVRFRSDILNADQWVTYTSTGAVTLDLSLGKKFIINLQANTTISLLNVPLNCKSIVVRLVQDATGGRTVSWWTGLSFSNNVAPALTPTPNKADEIGVNFLTVTNDTTNTSEGFIIGQNI